MTLQIWEIRLLCLVCFSWCRKWITGPWLLSRTVKLYSEQRRFQLSTCSIHFFLVNYFLFLYSWVGSKLWISKLIIYLSSFTTVPKSETRLGNKMDTAKSNQLPSRLNRIAAELFAREKKNGSTHYQFFQIIISALPRKTEISLIPVRQ